jgi:hypothetical protein
MLKPKLDEAVYVDQQWKKTRYAAYACAECGYIQNTKRNGPLDVILSSDSKLPMGPDVAKFGAMLEIFRDDYIDAIRLRDGGCFIGRVYCRGQLVAGYSTVLMHHSRWVFMLSSPTRDISTCGTCCRLLMNTKSEKLVIIRESIRTQADVYYSFGTGLLLSENAVDRISKSLLSEFFVQQVPVVSINDMIEKILI